MFYVRKLLFKPKVMAAYRQVDDLRSPASWLPVHRDQLLAQRSVRNMESLYLFYLIPLCSCRC